MVAISCRFESDHGHHKDLIRTPQRFVFSCNYVIIKNIGCDRMSKIDDINNLIIEGKVSGEISTKEISDGQVNCIDIE